MLNERDLRIDSFSSPGINGDWKFEGTHLPTGISVTAWGKDRVQTRKTVVEEIERKVLLKDV